MIRSLVARFASGLRFPTLFAITATLFVVDLLVPDLVPFADEIMLALGTLLLGTLRRKPATRPVATHPVSRGARPS